MNRFYDCHLHIFDISGRQSLAPGRRYDPPAADHEMSDRLSRACGITHRVVVQPTAYGFDNGFLIETMAALGEKSRGIAVVNPCASLPELEYLASCRIQGVRIVISDAEDEPARTLNRYSPLYDAIRHLGWHIQFLAPARMALAISRYTTDRGITAVFDHFSCRGSLPIAAEASALIDLVRDGSCWVKISGIHLFPTELWPQIDTLADALIAANSSRLLWGSDWPNIDHFLATDPHDAEQLAVKRCRGSVERLDSWTGRDSQLLSAILSSNPHRLYG